MTTKTIKKTGFLISVYYVEATKVDWAGRADKKTSPYCNTIAEAQLVLENWQPFATAPQPAPVQPSFDEGLITDRSNGDEQIMTVSQYNALQARKRQVAGLKRGNEYASQQPKF